ncbi:MAG: heavy-metal-associated domain-containing protein [Ruminiclostridium sp.]|nr:heavy-metal-associated domain-containing protein [Ruminiclostridium sp.]
MEILQIIIPAVIVSALVIIAIISVKTYLKNLTQGCCGSGGGKENEISVDKSDFSEYKYKYTVEIAGMTCKNCSIRISNVFNRKDGILADVSYEDGCAIIYSKESLKDLSIRQTIVGLGYSVSGITEEI